MSDNIRISITAKDDASDDFQRISQNAARMGQQVTQAGRSASQGLKPVSQDAKAVSTAMTHVQQASAKSAQGLDKIGASARKADQEIDRISKSSTRAGASWVGFGASLTTVVGVLSDASRAAAEEEVIFTRLEAAVDATGESYSDYAVQIDAAIAASEELSFADDKAAEALSNLTTITGDASEALDLLGLAQDLARGKGIDLATASTIVGKVAEGNIGILTRYGIAVQEGATAQEALGQLQERFAGQAQAYADSTQGAIDRVKNAFDNQLETIGANTAQFQTLFAILPGVSAGYTIVGGAAGKAAQGIKALTEGTRAAGLATSALSVATGPVGIAIGAAALAAGGAYLAYRKLRDEQDNLSISSKEFEQTGKDLVAFLNLLGEQGAKPQTLTAVREGVEFLYQIREASQAARPELNALNEEIDNQRQLYLDLDQAARGGSVIAAERAEAVKANIEAMEAQRVALEGVTIDENSWNEVVKNTQTLLSDTSRVNYPEIVAAVESLNAQLLAGTITHDQYIDGIADITAHIDSFGLSLDDVAPKVESIRHYFNAWTRDILANNAARTAGLGIGFTDPGDGGFGAVPASAAAATDSFRGVSTALEAVKDRSNEAAAGQIKLAAGMAASSAAAAENAAELQTAVDAAIAFAGQTENISDLLQASFGDPFIGVADSLSTSQQALDNTFQTIIGGSEALAQSGQQVADWASGLTNLTFEGGVFATEVQKVEAAFAAGEISAEDYAVAIVEAQSSIDTALAKGNITRGEYDAAMTASTDILWNNALIQEDIAAIQAKQAPFIADATNAYQDQVAALADLEPAEQRHALALIDAGSRARIAETYSTAYAASLGQIPEDVATELILNAAAVDPILAEYYKEKGLIETDPITGELTVNFDAFPVDEATQAITELSEEIDDLTAAINALNGTEINPKINDDFLAKLKNMGDGYDNFSRNYAQGREGGTPLAPGGLNDGTGGAGGSITPPPIPLTLDLQFFNASMSEAEQRLNDTISTEYIATLSSDPSGAISGAALAGDAAHQAVDPAYLLTITGDGTGGVNAAHEAGTAANVTVDDDYKLIIQGDATGGVNAAADAAEAGRNVNNTHSMIFIDGDNSGARAAINGVTGYQGTAYVTVVANRIGNFGPESPFRDGGVVGYDAAALDGIVTKSGMRRILVGEAGREILNVPVGSSVTPAPMTRAIAGSERRGRELHFNFYGPVYGTDDLQQMIGQAVQSAAYAGHLS